MEFFGTLDDANRISLPAKVRGGKEIKNLILTKGMNKCIWVFLPEEWEKFSKSFIYPETLSLNKQLKMQSHFISPKAEVEIDKAGRITIPPTLRKYACLSRDCILMEVVNRLEIWDSNQYEAYSNAIAEDIPGILEEMGPFLSS